jgi:hypothetical protein
VTQPRVARSVGRSLSGYVTVDDEVSSTLSPAAGILCGGTCASDLLVNALHVHQVPMPPRGMGGTIDVIVRRVVAHAGIPQTHAAS